MQGVRSTLIRLPRRFFERADSAVLGALRRPYVLLSSFFEGVIELPLMRCMACPKLRLEDGPCACNEDVRLRLAPQSRKPFRRKGCSLIIACTAVVEDLSRVRRLWSNELQERRSRAFVSRDCPREHDRRYVREVI